MSHTKGSGSPSPNGRNPTMTVALGVPLQQPEGTLPVYLKAYDLSCGLAEAISIPLLGSKLEGVWHTAIAVYGNEYMFGDGIWYCDEESCEKSTGYPLIRKILLGYTAIPKDLFDSYLSDIGPQFTTERYNLIEWNCNHFSNTVAEFLVGNGIPSEYLVFIDKIKSSPHGKKLLDLVVNARKANRNNFVVPGQQV